MKHHRRTTTTRRRLMFAGLLAVALLTALSGAVVGQTNTQPAGITEAASEAVSVPSEAADYTVVDTGQTVCYDDTTVISCPEAGEPFYG